jgi:hypothetical protein
MMTCPRCVNLDVALMREGRCRLTSEAAKMSQTDPSRLFHHEGIDGGLHAPPAHPQGAHNQDARRPDRVEHPSIIDSDDNLRAVVLRG